MNLTFDRKIPFLKTDLAVTSWNDQLKVGINFILRNQSTFRVRRMIKNDIERVVHLEKGLFRDPWPATAFSYELDEPERNLSLVGIKENSVIAYAVCRIIFDELHIDNLAVAPKFQHEGCGSTMLWTILQFVSYCGILVCHLEVRKSNSEAIALYQKFGFKTVGIRKNYYVNEKEDALLMSLANEFY